MSGRAGRRGIDERGIVILIVDEKMGPDVGKGLLKVSVYHLFAFTYIYTRQYYININVCISTLTLYMTLPYIYLIISRQLFSNCIHKFTGI